MTKDADAYVGGGNHFATWIEDGVLSVMFEGDNARKTFTAGESRPTRNTTSRPRSATERFTPG